MSEFIKKIFLQILFYEYNKMNYFYNLQKYFYYIFFFNNIKNIIKN